MVGERAWPIASTLLGTFGSLAAALDARPSRLRKALLDDKELATTIVAMRTLFQAAANETRVSSPVSVDCTALRAHIRARVGSASHERLLVVFADARFEHIGEALFTDESALRLRASMRAIFDRALELRASALLLAHNHPSGHTSPSQNDIDSTRSIEAIAKSLDIWLIDHLIVADHRMYSMRRGDHL